MKGVALTMMTREGIRTYVYECHSGATLAEIVNGTTDSLDPRFGERIVSIEVD